MLVYVIFCFFFDILLCVCPKKKRINCVLFAKEIKKSFPMKNKYKFCATILCSVLSHCRIFWKPKNSPPHIYKHSKRLHILSEMGKKREIFEKALLLIMKTYNHHNDTVIMQYMYKVNGIYVIQLPEYENGYIFPVTNGETNCVFHFIY